MKLKILPLFILFISVLALVSVRSSAQTNITSSGATTQTFDAMASGSSLPSNWKMSAAGTGTSGLSWLNGTNVTTTSFAASSGTPSTGGRYNWGTSAGTDRAVGFMTDASYASANAVMAFYRNTSGSTIHSFTLSYNVERYKIDASTVSVSFYTSTDGVNWTLQPTAEIGIAAFAPGAVSYTFSSPALISRSITFNNANLANNSDIYFKWLFVNTGNITAQGIGLDDVSLTVNTPTIISNLGDILSDANSDGIANPGEIITYKDTVKNTGSANALVVSIIDTLAPTGTTKIAGSVKTSVVAVDDNFSANFNTPLSGVNVLTNDFGFPLPQVISYGTVASNGVTTPAGTAGSTDAGGSITITSAGALSYTSPNNFTGIDKFKYIAGNAVAGLPNNDAVVSIYVSPSAPTFTTTNAQPLCNGQSNGSITVNASGGSGSYSYSKDNGATYQSSNVFSGLAGGTYQVVVKDAITGLTQNASVTLTAPASVSFTFSKTDITCNNANNGTITFNSTTGGTSPYTYSITGTGGTFQSGTAFTSLTAGSYTLVAKDVNGCLSSTTATTVVNPLSVAVTGTTILTLTYSTVMSTSTYIKSGGTGTLTFSISGTLPTGVTFTAGAGTLTGTPTQVGSFPVSIIATDANGCTASLGVTITVKPNLVGDSYTAVANTQLVADGHSSPATPFTTSVTNILTNDASNQAITVTAGTFATTNGGSITINAAGKFTFTPLNGSIAPDSYTYTGTSNGIAATATINFTFPVPTIIWYVNNTYAGANGAANGSSHRPYTTVSSAATASAVNNIIYVHTGTGNTTGDALLKTGQTLRGAGTALTVGALSLAAGTKPTLTGMVTLATNVTVDGFDMTTGSTTAFTNAGTTVTGVTVNVGTVTTTTGIGITLTGTGNSVSMTLASLTVNGAGNAVTLTNTSGTVTINAGTITGGAGAPFNINGGTVSLTYSGSTSQGTAGQPLVNVTGNHTTGTILFNTGTLNATNGTGLQFDNSDGIYTFSGTTTLNGGDAGIDILNGSTGTFHFADLGGSISITNPSGTAFNTINSSPAVTFAGTISQNTASQFTVNIDGTSSNTINFTNLITAASTNALAKGVNISNCNGGNVSFVNLNLGTSGNRMTGGTAINISKGTGNGNGIFTLGTISLFTNGQNGLTATDIDGVVNVSGGSIDASSGTAFSVDGPVGLTTLGVTLTSITSLGGTANGITIIDVNGTFTVNGDGANTAVGGNSSGGTISNKSGADGSTTTGIGIYLSNATGVVLRRITVNGTNQNYGVRAASISGLTIEYCAITGSNGTNDLFDEDAIRFTEITGAVNITNCTISGGYENIFTVVNTSGTLNRLVISGCSFGTMNTSFGNDGLSIETQSTAVINATVQNCTFTAARGDHFQFNVANSTTNDIVFIGNTITNNIIAVAGGGGLRFTGGSNTGSLNSGMTYTISNNTMSGSIGTALAVNKLGGSGNFTGTITNNVIGIAATAGSGSTDGSGIFLICDGPSPSSHTTTISGNTIRQFGNYGIYIQTGGSGVIGSATMNLTVTGNIITNPNSAAFPTNGFHLNAGVTPSDTYFVCLNIGGAGALANSFTSTGLNGGTDFRVRQRQSTTVRLSGYGGAATDNAAVVTFIQGRNGTTPTGSAANTFPTGGGFIGGAACAQ